MDNPSWHQIILILVHDSCFVTDIVEMEDTWLINALSYIQYPS